MALEPALSLHRRIQELLLGFSRGISASLSVGGALESLCTEVNDLFGTRRVSVWIHYRRARELALSGSSDAGYAAAATRVLTDSETIPARGLRLESPQFLTPTPAVVPEPSTTVLLALCGVIGGGFSYRRRRTASC